MAKSRKRKRPKGKRKSGVLMGMRSGFKNVASSVTGQKAPTSRRGNIISTAITVALLIVAALLLFRRFR